MTDLIFIGLFIIRLIIKKKICFINNEKENFCIKKQQKSN